MALSQRNVRAVQRSCHIFNLYVHFPHTFSKSVTMPCVLDFFGSKQKLFNRVIFREPGCHSNRRCSITLCSLIGRIPFCASTTLLFLLSIFFVAACGKVLMTSKYTYVSIRTPARLSIWYMPSSLQAPSAHFRFEIANTSIISPSTNRIRTKASSTEETTPRWQKPSKKYGQQFRRDTA